MLCLFTATVKRSLSHFKSATLPFGTSRVWLLIGMKTPGSYVKYPDAPDLGRFLLADKPDDLTTGFVDRRPGLMFFYEYVILPAFHSKQDFAQR